MVAGCATDPVKSPAGTATSAVMPAPAETPVSAPIPTPVDPSTMPGLVATGTLEDAVGDLVNSDRRRVNTPGYIDIRDLEAVADGSTLRLTLTLAGELPPPPPPATERLSYNVNLLTDGDLEARPDGAGGGQSWTIDLSNAAMTERYQPTLWDLPEQSQGVAIGYPGAQFPGTAVVTGDTIVWTVALAALGSPAVIRLSVLTSSVMDTGADGKVGTNDELPDGGVEDRLLLEP